MNAHRAYDAGFTGEGVNVAVLDSGLYGDHREFLGRMSGYSLDVDDGGPVRGDATAGNGHGTGVAAVVVANRDGVGMHGIAYGAHVTPIHDGEKVGLDDALTRTYARLPGYGVEVVNISSGIGIHAARLTQQDADIVSEDMLPAARRSVEDGIVSVISAGNGRISEPDFVAGLPYFYPELENGWLSVVATRSDDRLTTYSQGCGVAANWCLAAPGGDVGSADGTFLPEYFLLPGASGGYYLSAGTSFSAPMVAGALAISREIFPQADIGDLRRLILKTAVDIGDPGVDPVFGWGRLNLGNVVDTISPRGRSIFASAAHARQLSMEQVSRLPFGTLARSRRIQAVWAAADTAREHSHAETSGETRSQSRAFAVALDLVDQAGLTGGAGVAFTRSKTDETGTANTASANGVFGFGYADWTSGRWYVRGTAGIGYLKQKHARRSIPGLAGTVMALEEPQASSHTNGLGILANLEFGRSFDAGLIDVTLFGHVSASSHTMKGFRERDLDLLAYTVDAGRLSTAVVGPGLRVSRTLGSGEWTLSPEIEISYGRVLGDTAATVHASLLERPMEARTAELGRNMFGLGAKLSLTRPGSGFTAELGYKGAFRHNARQSSIQFSLSMAF